MVCPYYISPIAIDLLPFCTHVSLLNPYYLVAGYICSSFSPFVFTVLRLFESLSAFFTLRYFLCLRVFFSTVLAFFKVTSFLFKLNH